MKLHTIPPYGMTFPKQGMVLATAPNSTTSHPETFPTSESKFLISCPDENPRVYFGTVVKKKVY